MILAGAHEVLPAAPWQSAHDYRLFSLETLEETRRFLSTCRCRADNRVLLGQAKGRGKLGTSSKIETIYQGLMDLPLGSWSEGCANLLKLQGMGGPNIYSGWSISH